MTVGGDCTGTADFFWYVWPDIYYQDYPPSKPLIDFLTDLYHQELWRLSVIGNYITRPGIWPIWLIRKTVKSITAPGRSRHGGRRK